MHQLETVAKTDQTTRIDWTVSLDSHQMLKSTYLTAAAKESSTPAVWTKVSDLYFWLNYLSKKFSLNMDPQAL